ncbi:hypothetical protein CIRG_02064 [Coccidioides immitis RMSCC 2394]|uniref:Uncharacterized protein n=1 Tax=Coccidioides immitis RMSCC 2394 TaxID=404692 RepID=A0A0J6Y2I6_COCIT|nr:hypothetical protein CIRG_02064 [Coccidioides immitis RMSCC 2394]
MSISTKSVGRYPPVVLSRYNGGGSLTKRRNIAARISAGSCCLGKKSITVHQSTAVQSRWCHLEARNIANLIHRGEQSKQHPTYQSSRLNHGLHEARCFSVRGFIPMVVEKRARQPRGPRLNMGQANLIFTTSSSTEEAPPRLTTRKVAQEKSDIDLI